MATVTVIPALRDMMRDMGNDDARQPGHGAHDTATGAARLISIVSPEFRVLPEFREAVAPPEGLEGAFDGHANSAASAAWNGVHGHRKPSP